MHNERVNLGMNYGQALMVVSEGNPGAARVLVDLATQGPAIDGDSALAEWGGILALDSHGIYGSDIWLMYKDLCEQSYVRMLAVLRAVQLGLERESTVKNAIEFAKAPWDKTNPLPSERISGLHAEVCRKLPKFQRPARSISSEQTEATQ